MILLLTEMKEHTDVVALDASGNVYNIDSLIEEIKQGTALAQETAKTIIGMAFEMALSEQNHEKRNQQAKDYFDKFQQKYGHWFADDEDQNV